MDKKKERYWKIVLYANFIVMSICVLIFFTDFFDKWPLINNAAYFLIFICFSIAIISSSKFHELYKNLEERAKQNRLPEQQELPFK